MTIAAFALLAAVALAAAAVAVWRGPAWAVLTLALALAGVALLYEAPGLALLEVTAVGAAALVIRVARGPARADAPAEDAEVAPTASRTRLVAVGAATAGVVFVLVGTWARQFVWTGREPTPGSGFGELPALAGALAGAPALLGIGLLLVVVAAACAGPPRHRI